MKKFIQEKHQEAALDDLKTILAYPSYLQEDDETPFGKDIQAVLEKTLEISEELGFKTYIDPEGYYGYAEMGEGEELFAVLCHLDVVPPGNLALWDSKPFEPTVKDGFIIARGSQDDKGPTIAAMYALKAVMDAGETLNKRVRFIFGVDEENLWRCLNRYNELEEKATMGFAPDSTFPVTYAEKGLLQIKLHSKETSSYHLEAGDAMNVVPEDATYEGEWADDLESELKKNDYSYERDGQSITVKGKSVHSKNSPQGINAIVRLANVLTTKDDNKALLFLRDYIQEDARGLNIFGEVEDEASGILTCNAATLSINPEETVLGIDIRYPVTVEKSFVGDKLKAAAEKAGLIYEEYDFIAPLYVPLDTPLVENLMAVYQEKTGDMQPPIVSGGATFARTMENCVAFGAQLPHAEATLHGPNERMALEDLYQAMDIYAEALYRLTCQ
ncbi:M20 family metallopeptidase [Jeotgalibaca dankookensis]|uniref:M20 family metallopeptidase n=1 Tax=Jeotgalibaca dankookensis TaxID=708126 RepID=UPI0007801D53|nr:M20 family metallopeptidase [Jeotgalibaca dankookensis]